MPDTEGASPLSRLVLDCQQCRTGFHCHHCVCCMSEDEIKQLSGKLRRFMRARCNNGHTETEEKKGRS